MNEPPIHLHIVTAGTAEGPAAWDRSFAQLLSLSVEQLQGRPPQVHWHCQGNHPASLGLGEVAVLVIGQDLLALPLLLQALEEKLPEWEAARRSVFKAMRLPVQRQALPAGLRELLAYPFYELQASTGVVKPYEQLERLDAAHPFWGNLVDLAYDLTAAAEARSEHDWGQQQSVYLAEADAANQAQRHAIKRELQRHGYRVLPQAQLPADAAALRRTVQSALSASAFSIHLIGDSRGAEVPGEGMTLEQLQLQLASQYGQTHPEGFRRLVWLPPGLQAEDERQAHFIEALCEHAGMASEGAKGMEVVQVRLEDFKSMLLRQLAWQVRQAAQVTPPAPADARPSLYLMAGPRDEALEAQAAAWAERHGWALLRLDPASKEPVRAQHNRCLSLCDAGLLLFHSASPEWAITRLQDVLKSPGLGRQKPLGPLAVVAGGEGQRQTAERLMGAYRQYPRMALLDASHAWPDSPLQQVLAGTSTQQQPTAP
jgi:hypothetical protein